MPHDLTEHLCEVSTHLPCFEPGRGALRARDPSAAMSQIEQGLGVDSVTVMMYLICIPLFVGLGPPQPSQAIKDKGGALRMLLFGQIITCSLYTLRVWIRCSHVEVIEGHWPST